MFRSTSGVTECGSHLSAFRFLVKHPTNVDLVNSYRGSAHQRKIEYVWYYFTFLIKWHPTNGALVLCINQGEGGRPLIIAELIRAALREVETETLSSNPFTFHSLLTGLVVEQFSRSFWAWRDIMRSMEKNRSAAKGRRADYTAMHEYARHVIHSVEMLEMAMRVTENMIDEATRFAFNEKRSGSQSTTMCPILEDTISQLRYQRSLLDSVHLCFKSLGQRLSHEINLVSNINHASYSRDSD